MTCILRRLPCGTWRAELEDTFPPIREEGEDVFDAIEKILLRAPLAAIREGIVYKMALDSLPGPDSSPAVPEVAS